MAAVEEENGSDHGSNSSQSDSCCSGSSDHQSWDNLVTCNLSYMKSNITNYKLLFQKQQVTIIYYFPREKYITFCAAILHKSPFS